MRVPRRRRRYSEAQGFPQRVFGASRDWHRQVRLHRRCRSQTEVGPREENRCHLQFRQVNLKWRAQLQIVPAALPSRLSIPKL